MTTYYNSIKIKLMHVFAFRGVCHYFSIHFFTFIYFNAFLFLTNFTTEFEGVKSVKTKIVIDEKKSSRTAALNTFICRLV